MLCSRSNPRHGKPSLLCDMGAPTKEDISVQASALGRARANVDRESLSLGDITAWDIGNQPVTPLPPLGVCTTGSIRIYMCVVAENSNKSYAVMEMKRTVNAILHLFLQCTDQIFSIINILTKTILMLFCLEMCIRRLK